MSNQGCSAIRAQRRITAPSQSTDQHHGQANDISEASRETYLTEEKIRDCIEVLERTFQSSSLAVSSFVCCVLSLLSSKLGDIHKFEVSALLLRLFDADFGPENRPSEEDLSVQWMEQCREVVVENKSGYVDFANDDIRLFLKHTGIETVDTTHKTITTACLKQLEYCEIPVMERQQPLGLFMLRHSHYAIENWAQHYRYAEQTSPAVTSRLHKLLHRQLCPESWSKPMSNPRLLVADDLGFCSAGAGTKPVDEAIAFCKRHKFIVLCRAYELTRVGIAKCQGSFSDPKPSRDVSACTYRDQRISKTSATLSRLRLFDVPHSVITHYVVELNTDRVEDTLLTSRTPSRENLRDWEMVDIRQN